MRIIPYSTDCEPVSLLADVPKGGICNAVLHEPRA